MTTPISARVFEEDQAAAPAERPPGPPGSPSLNLKRGGQNDAAEVRNLQRLLSDLKVGSVAPDGQYGASTEAAVKAAQAKLGMKPTGRASSSLIRRMADAHALSPCVNRVAASEYTDADGRDAERVTAASAAGLDLTLWSDSTVWLTDAYGDQVELDRDDADRVVAGLRQLPDLPGTYEISDWLTLEVDADGSAALVAAEGEDDDEAIELRLADLNEFADQLAAMFEAAPVTAAAGMDVTPGHDELHHYWTKDPEGLAKWVDSPTPWTALVAHLTPHVGPAKAKVFASRWFIEVFGYAAGSDKNRVAHGHPPRGHNVGPG